MELLQETLNIIRDRHYTVDGRQCGLKFAQEATCKAAYLNAEGVAWTRSHVSMIEPDPYSMGGWTDFYCLNEDSFSAARRLMALERYQNELLESKKKPEVRPNNVLVLNFASSIRPGGGVRHGGQGQEEDLCRKSTLLASLESPAAAPFYAAHRVGGSPMASDAIILSPYVVVFRDENNALLKDPPVVAVLSCAAPKANAPRKLPADALEKLLYDRIESILHVAAAHGYRYLVLGAWGCGASGNDAKQVSRLFYQALKGFSRGNADHNGYFHAVAFAVPDHSASQYKFKCFEEQFKFQNFYAEELAKLKEAEEKEKEQERLWCLNFRQKHEPYLDKVRGGLLGGAVGDALGYPVEFLSWHGIQSRYGSKGIQSHDPDMGTGLALISDDTQMTLFTANGVLFQETRGLTYGIASSPCSYIRDTYRDWLLTQTGQSRGEEDGCSWHYSWLLDIPELFNRRAPGGTCLSALSSGQFGTIEKPINDSKGCGGIMRVAPVGLHYDYMQRKEIDRIGAEAAALTHGHSLGYIPAAVLTHILNVAVYGGCPRGETLLDAVEDAMDTASELFGQDRHWPELRTLVDRAEALAGNDADDVDNIHVLGGGWVAEETLAIAIYCALRYSNDFSKGIVAAVNHSGDSDSTGAVTGNILGAWLGCGAIEEKWTHNLELRGIILEMADDLCYGCPLDGYHCDRDPRWRRKYIEGRYPKGNSRQSGG